MLLTTQPAMQSGDFLREIMLWSGYLLIIAGAFGRVYCSAFIGGRKNENVVRSGPFSVVRNPLYVFSFLATVGIGMQSGMIIAAILLPLSFVIYYPFVVAKEEEFLRHKFAEEYNNYTKEVPRWIPDLRLWNEPEIVEGKPEFIRRTISDAAWFFAAMPLFKLIEFLQTNNIVPVWLILP